MLQKWIKKALLQYFLLTRHIDNFNLPLSMNGFTTTYEQDETGNLPYAREYEIRRFKNLFPFIKVVI